MKVIKKRGSVRIFFDLQTDWLINIPTGPSFLLELSI